MTIPATNIYLQPNIYNTKYAETETETNASSTSSSSSTSSRQPTSATETLNNDNGYNKRGKYAKDGGNFLTESPNQYKPSTTAANKSINDGNDKTDGSEKDDGYLSLQCLKPSKPSSSTANEPNDNMHNKRYKYGKIVTLILWWLYCIYNVDIMVVILYI